MSSSAPAPAPQAAPDAAPVVPPVTSDIYRWTRLDDGRWVRSCYGLDMCWDQLWLNHKDFVEIQAGAGLVTTLSDEELVRRLVNALAVLRWECPHLASKMEMGVQSPNWRSYVYTPAKSYDEVKAWAEEAVELLPKGKFTPLALGEHLNTEAPFPTPLGNWLKLYVNPLPDNFDGHLAAEAALNGTSTSAQTARRVDLVVHSPHQYFDAQGHWVFFHNLFRIITKSPAVDPAQFAWGQEKPNKYFADAALDLLPARTAEVTAASQAGVMEMLGAVASKPSLGLTAQRDEPIKLGRSFRAVRYLSPEELDSLKRGIKKLGGYTVTQALLAASNLAVVESLPKSVTTEDIKKHQLLSFPFALSARKYFPQLDLWGPQVMPTTCCFPVGTPAELTIASSGEVVQDAEAKKQALASMIEVAKSTSDKYVNWPHIIDGNTILLNMTKLNSREATFPTTPMMMPQLSSIGVIDTKLQTLWYEGDGNQATYANNAPDSPTKGGKRERKQGEAPVFSVVDFSLHWRMTLPMTWMQSFSLNGRLSVQTAYSDFYDAEYVEAFMDRVTANLELFKA